MCGVFCQMGFHNHLHAKPDGEHKVSPSVYPFIAVLGLVGMIFTIVGNIKQTKEMYPSYLRSNNGAVFQIPVSFFFSIFSDLCLVLYGILSEDIIIILYGILNSTVILLTMVYIQRQHAKSEEKLLSHIPLPPDTIVGFPCNQKQSRDYHCDFT